MINLDLKLGDAVLDLKLGDAVQLLSVKEKLPLIGLITRMMEESSTNMKFLRLRWLLRL